VNKFWWLSEMLVECNLLLVECEHTGGLRMMLVKYEQMLFEYEVMLVGCVLILLSFELMLVECEWL
jgi:hypothetical protein